MTDKGLITITFGSNKYIDTDGIISVRYGGKLKDLFKVDYRISDLMPLITVEIRDKSSKLLGKLYRSSHFLYSDPDYEPEYVRDNGELKKILLVRKSDKEVVFELIFHSPRNIESNGIFYMKNINLPIIASRAYLQCGRMRISRSTFRNVRKAIVLDLPVDQKA